MVSILLPYTSTSQSSNNGPDSPGAELVCTMRIDWPVPIHVLFWYKSGYGSDVSW